ncbi:MAG: nickel pincer cofactor biosynthesis protein LarB [Bacteroidetes bacterium]|nr:nickel pincer cofactor biosynthesis protein LarB [Bacteroidota bacterium]
MQQISGSAKNGKGQKRLPWELWPTQLNRGKSPAHFALSHVSRGGYITVMDSSQSIWQLLKQLSEGGMNLDQCAEEIEAAQRRHLEVGDYARLDLARRERTGFPEVVYAPGKTLDELHGILGSLLAHDRKNILMSRLPKDSFDALSEGKVEARYYERSSTAVFAPQPPETLIGRIALVTAGTSDLAVAEEIEVACTFAGSSVVRFADVGVAGLDRLLAVLPDIARAQVCVCVAGMEAALPSVLAGLLSIPVIGVPTSTGYGVNQGGINALLSMLGSCAPGVLVVNIDNGIGAAAAAHRINTLIAAGSHD